VYAVEGAVFAFARINLEAPAVVFLAAIQVSANPPTTGVRRNSGVRSRARTSLFFGQVSGERPGVKSRKPCDSMDSCRRSRPACLVSELEIFAVRSLHGRQRRER